MVDVEPCPICGQRLPDPYALTLHVEEAHTDDSPFVVRDDEPATPSTASLPGYEEDMKEQQPQDETSMDANNQYALCPEEGCGEQLLLGDINEHLDLHEAEDVTFQEQNHQPTPSRSKAKDLSALHTAHSSSSPSRSSTKHKKIRSPSHTHSSHRRRVKRHSPAGKENNNRIGLGRKFLFWVANMSQGRPSKSLRNGSRLGASELGPYAYEDRMPAWLFKQLEDGPPMRQIKKLGRDGRYTVQEVVEGETSGVLPILSRLSALDPRVRTAYYCHPSVLQIGKAKNEGGFCGFRNLQMQVSYIQGAKAPGYEKFPGRTPGVLQLQDWIEKAWDQGICETSRAEIGQLLGTRKWIGTMEALALYHYMDIKVMARTFGDQHGRYAHQRLLDWVEDYFRSSAPHDLNKVVTTLKPPIYLQRPCHSMTIIGLERMRDGTRNLLVFDPLYCAPRIMQDMIDRGPQAIHVPNEKFMRLYRRHETKLYPYLDFEVLE
ncbi:DUF1671-domain-containing protein [Trichodelitschia bisporula]|uniref:DUF1671-domain-containing protein n=1 Tax=Trichodelitschia bisporula TaxID=703511 RepID=A0A6G1I8P8_9PEZI|nr:DUF1671-domain-containing protein [Trichodelitschia bisporula]